MSDNLLIALELELCKLFEHLGDGDARWSFYGCLYRAYRYDEMRYRLAAAVKWVITTASYPSPRRSFTADSKYCVFSKP
jgi:hypothetical protein